MGHNCICGIDWINSLLTVLSHIYRCGPGTVILMGRVTTSQDRVEVWVAVVARQFLHGYLTALGAADLFNLFVQWTSLENREVSPFGTVADLLTDHYKNVGCPNSEFFTRFRGHTLCLIFRLYSSGSDLDLNLARKLLLKPLSLLKILKHI